MDVMMPDDKNGTNESAMYWMEQALDLRRLVGELVDILVRTTGYMEPGDQAVLRRARIAVEQWRP